MTRHESATLSASNPVPTTLPGLLEAQAGTGSALAGQLAFTFLDDGRHEGPRLTFAELDAQARQWAARLQCHAGAGERVLLALPPGTDYIVLFWACMYAGVIAVPALPPTTQAGTARLHAIAADARASLGIVPAALPARGADGPAGTTRWIGLDELARAPQRDWVRPAIAPDDIAFLQYTSGSTGEPKGVIVSHANVLANCALIRERLAVAPGDCVVSWLPPHHDMGLIGTILGAVYCGCHSVQFAPAAFLRRPWLWLQALAQYRARITAAPNFAYQLCVDRVAQEALAGLDLSGLEHALNGAEPVRGTTLAQFARHLAPTGLRPGAIKPVYGLAEATLLVTAGVDHDLRSAATGHALSRVALADGRAVPGADGDIQTIVGCGRPGTGHDVRIVDRTTGRPAAPGSVGEIWVAGPSVGGGYWGRAALSDEVFRARLPEDDRTYLRTGDLGVLVDGELLVTGRVKDMMIFAGRNVYPQDLEATIGLVSPSIRPDGAAAFAVEDESGARLVAVVEIDPRAAEQGSTLVAALRAALADQHELVALEALLLVRPGTLPRTSSGKLRRAHCRDLYRDDRLPVLYGWRAGQGRAAGAAPATPTEHALAAIWCDVLGCAAPGVDQDFFSSGGHSLAAAQVLAHVRARWRVRLTLRDLFEATTIGTLAARIDAAGAEEPIARAGGERPLAPAQQRLWFLDELDAAASRAYHLCCGVRLGGELDTAVLTRALDRIVERHAVLRSRIVRVGERMEQVPAEPAGFPLQYHDLSMLDGAARPAALAQLEQTLKEARFDLAAGDVARAQLVKLDARDHVLLLAVQHIAADGVSMQLMLRELHAHYEALQSGAAPLAPPAIGYADYAAWQWRRLAQDDCQDQRAFWTSELAGAPALLALATDRPRPARPSYRSARVELVLGTDEVAGLRHLAEAHQCTLYMVLLAAWSLLLARMAGQDEVVIGTPVAHRERPELGDVIGFVAQTLPLRVRVGRAAQLGDLLRSVKETLLAALDNQELPFEHMVEVAQPVRTLAYNPLFQVMLSLQGATPALATRTGLAFVPFALDPGATPFDLSLVLEEDRDAVRGYLDYATDLFDPGSASALLERLRTLLDQFVRAPAAHPLAVPLLPAAERHRLVHDLNGTAVPLEEAGWIDSLLTAQAGRCPDAIALEADGHAWTYAELERCVNLLAHRLQSLGAVRGTRVAVCAERSGILVIGLLAVLRAGAAYVPLDPSYPHERLADMLSDSAPVVLMGDAEALARFDGVPVLALDQPGLFDGSDAGVPAVAGRSPLDPAYVIYTSGSTGRPKGVVVGHAGVLNLLAAMGTALGVRAGDRVLALTTVGFDIAALELYLPLWSGARVVLLARQHAADAHALAARLDSAEVTLMQATPSTWRMLLDSGWRGRPGMTAISGGEALPAALARALLDRVGSLWNAYGPTETTIWSTLARVTPESCAVGEVVPIGRPLSNTRLYVLDSQGELAPYGAVGELAIGGIGVAHGYLGRPGLSAGRFVPDPFAPRGRLYLTGDLVRYRADGSLDYLGRNDFQVKIRGHRIEPGEIEAVLARHPRVGHAAVVARPGPDGEAALVAYVTPRAQQAQRGASASLFFFGAEGGADDPYRVYLDAARHADTHGYEAIWTPERHFHEVGQLYPNPAVLSAALTQVTERVHLRAGSVVLPLHHPVRVAEEWAVVDRLSQGRAGIALASGWHPRDFALAPESYARRRELLWEGMDQLQTLWAGGELTHRDGTGAAVTLRSFPRPQRGNLPLWVTAAGNPDTFLQAGKRGAHVLTHLLGQSIEQVAAHIAAYRDSLRAHGHDPAAGRVTLMIHTFVGADLAATVERARAPFLRYLRSHLGLLDALVKGLGLTPEDSSPETMESVIGFAFERYTRTASLIGTPESCLPVWQQLEEAGVDEIACLIDWMDEDSALAGLAGLDRLRALARNAAPSARALRRHAGALLPAYMVPAAFVCLDALPLTPNGKLARDRLPAPVLVAVQASAPPRGELEEQVARLWCELLRVDSVGRDQDFFELGGHSLLAVQLVNRARARFDVELALHHMFALPTVAGLAAAIGRAQRGDTPAVPRARRDAPLVLSWPQEGLWVLQRMDAAAGAAYAMPAGLRLRGVLDRASLVRALDRLIARHESLRTTFPAADGVPGQHIGPADCGFPLVEDDLAALAPPAREAALAQLCEVELDTPFDLAHGPLARARLVRMDEQDHVLLINRHHMVSDGWSTGILVRELRALYGAFRRGDADPLPPLALQYADFAAWQRARFDGASAAGEEGEFWRRHLTGMPAALTLPLDYPRPARQSYDGAKVDLVLPASLHGALKTLAQDSGCTLFMTLVAAWALMLARLAGQSNVVVGTPVANRSLAQFEPLIGFCANTVALPVQVAGARDVGELLQRVKRSALAAFAHQELPFQHVVDAVQPARSARHHPLFQTMLTLENAWDTDSLAMAELQLETVDLPQRFSHFDLSITFTERGGALAARIDYARALFAPDSVARFAAGFRTLLASMAGPLDKPLSALSLLDAQARAAQLALARGPVRAPGGSQLWHRRFEEQAARDPDALALAIGDQTCTYGALNRLANGIAGELLARGLRPDQRVGLLARRSVGMVAGLLGILKAGGAYVPLDPDHPAPRRAQILADSGAVALVAEPGLDHEPGLALPVLLLPPADLRPLPGAADVNPDPSGVDPRGTGLAYVIYTSGSTGTPKGVMVPHAAAVNFWQVLADGVHAGLPAGTRIALNASYTFDMSLKGLLQLLSGHTLVLIPQALRADGPRLLRYLAGQRVHALDCTPAQLRMLLDAGLGRDSVPTLQCVLLGGEAIDPLLWDRLRGDPAIRYVNMYGPTECTVDVTIGTILADDIHPHIGRAVDNVQVHVLDEHLEPAAVGQPGELYAGGAGLARGYLGRPGLTAERFVPDPYGPPGSRLYRTGDLARRLGDGRIVYLGRNDQQVKIRGFRIELGEIEARLGACAGVAAAAVLADGGPAHARLVAYVVADGGARPESGQLRATLLQVLPDYMVPATYVFLERLPLTANGKLDRSALPRAESEPAAAAQAPVGATELALAAIWQEVLGRQAVGRDENFFDLGGHSLLVMQVLSRIERHLGVEVPVQDLFTAPTVAALAARIAQSGQAGVDMIPVTERGGMLPLSWPQERLWFLDQMDRAGSGAYHMAAAFTLTGELDRAAFRHALEQLVGRHETLRTSFPRVDGVPCQRIADTPALAFAESDLAALGTAERQADLARRMHVEFATPFDLARGPLLRVHLLRLGAREHVLLLTQHHIVSDGWSIGVMVRELSVLYAARRSGVAAPLAPLAVQYADYAQWQRARLQGARLEALRAFWRDALTGAPELLAFPTDVARPQVQDHAGARYGFALDAGLSARVRALAEANGVTPFTVLLAAWAAVLARWSGQDEVVVGVAVANRRRPEVEGLIGFFVNTLPLRIRLDDTDSGATLLARVHAAALAAYEHQDLPFEQIVEAVRPARSTAYSPLFQTIVTMSQAPDLAGLEIPDLAVRPLETPCLHTKYELALAFADHDTDLAASLEYATALYSPATIARLAQSYVRLLDGLTQADPARVAALPLLTAAEGARQLAQFGVGPASEPDARGLHALFAARVAHAPDAPALRWDGQCLTYGGLDHAANHLAHQLDAAGVHAGDRVVLCAERGAAGVAAMVAILKTGAAYVPLDPEHPAERWGEIVRDCRARVVVCEPARQPALAAVAPGVTLLPLVLPSGSAAGYRSSAGGDGALAYVIYTSGSTGKPKGVMLPHRAVVRLARSQAAAQAVPGARVAYCANPAFDAAAWEIWSALVNGAELVVVPQHVLLDGAALAALVARERITVLHLTAGLFQQHQAALAQVLPGLACLQFGGDATDKASVDRVVREALPGRLLHCYGPTETSTFASVHEVGAADLGQARLAIGRPLAGTALYLLDPALNLLPAGVVGEICIGGDAVGHGYVDRPALTAERFVPDPFAGVPGRRLYRTGDRGRYRSDGTVEFLGRADRQIKLRGYRIEPDEIEAGLRGCPGVRAALVLARPGPDGGARLVAYLTLDPQAALTSAQLRAALAQRLPEYMLPTAFVILETWPLTPNGKVNRAALPEPAPDQSVRRAYAPPADDTERVIAGVWQALLGVDRIGREDNFFELGGHSLLAVRMLQELGSRGVARDVRSVFAHPTVAALAQAPAATPASVATGTPVPEQVSRIQPGHLDLVNLTQAQIDLLAATVPGGHANIADVYPLAPLQEGILYHHLRQEQGDLYLQRLVLEFADAGRAARFVAALNDVVARHTVLRTALRWHDVPQPLQAVWRSAPVPVERFAAHGADPLSALLEYTDPRQCRLDVAVAPLMRVIQMDGPEGGPCVLALLYHHLVCDHVTLELIIDEIGAVLAGRGAMLPPVRPYRDYIATLAPTVTGSEAYFRATLGDVQEPTVPFGVAELGDAQVVEARRALPDTLAAAVRAQARRHGVSPAVFFHLVFARMLAAASGRADVVFGTVLSGRAGAAAQGRTAGLLINTLPLRIALDQPVAAALGSTAAALAQLMAHEQTPLSVAQRCSGLAPTQPLFSALLNYRHSRFGARDGGSAGITLWNQARVLHSQERSNYPLTLCVDELPEGFGLTVLAASAIDAQLVLRSCEHVACALADACAAGAETALFALPALPERDRQYLIHQLNDTAAPYEREQLIHVLFERQASVRPDAPALACGTDSWTYAELNRRANVLARRLRALGAGPGTRVAVGAERGMEMVAALLAVLKAGSAYVPLDLAYPRDRLAYMLADSAPTVLLAGEDGLAGLAGANLPCLRLDEAPLWEGADPGNLDPAALGLDAGQLAYVIYTSGSTGQPKGVMVQHRPVINLIEWVNGQFGVRPADRILLSTSFCFDLSVYDMFGLLAAGGVVHVATRAEVADPRRLVSLLRNAAITFWDSAPAVCHQLLPYLEPGAAPGLDLRLAFFSGDWIPLDLPDGLRRAFPRCQVISLGGATEATVWSNYFPVGTVDPAWRSIPYGKPIQNARYYVLDPQLQPCAIGVAGDLYIGGECLSAGYFGKPALTAERYLDDPFVPGRMYRTGDRARYWSDGNLEFLGRADSQVKIRGFRVELGEIEARLLAGGDLRDALVVAHGGRAERRLVAYLVARPGSDVSPASLRAALAAVLPDYMLPAAYVLLPALPLTPNGKVDRAALPAPDAAALAQRPFAPPRGEAEACMAGLWQALLDVPQVGRDDHFFDLGGHSLLAMQLVARVRSAFGCELRLEDLFRQPVLAELTSLVIGGGSPAGTPLEPVAADVPGVLSWAQQRLWFLSRFDPAAQTSYHIPAGFLIRGALERAALRTALDGVVARHASLRTRFPAAADGTPLAIVDAVGTCAFEESDLSHLAGHELDFALDQKRLDEETRPFDLATGPLIRAQLVRTGADAHILLITQHHIVSDGWSVGLLWQETLALYEAALAGRPDPLPALPLQYGDYAHWQQRKLARDGVAPDLAYWRAQLAGAPELLTLPTDRPRPAQADHAGALYVLRLPAALTARLRALARRHDATLFMVLLGGWAALLARLSGQPEVVVGTALANRTRVETEPLIGFFVNTLALRIRAGEALDLPALLAHVRTTTLDAFAHQDVPFEQVVEAVNPPRSLSYPPLFQTMFTVNNAAVDVSAAAARAGLQVEHLPRRLVTARFDLALAISEHDADLCATFEYATALFDGATVARFAACYEHLLGAMADIPATPVNRLSLLSGAEHAALLAAHGRGAPAAPYRPLPRMFEERAGRAPTAPALDWHGAQVSYGALNERANRLAHWLIGQELGAEARVGICTDRGPDMVVALLAILKAGAAYVPLDPDYPAERLAFMQRDAGLALVLTQQALEQRCAPARRVLLDDPGAPWTTAPAHDPAPVPDARQLAYLIYTSGSTGAPKAALLEHGGLSQLVQAQIRLFQVDAASRMLQFASSSFDAATAEIGVALAAGACLVLAERAAIAPGPTLAGFLRSQGVTHVTLPPAVLALTDPAGLDALRVVVVAGEACPPDVVQRWAPRRRMLNAYGPSETTVCASVAVLEPDADPIPLGQPLDGAQLYVLDAAGQPVAPGEPGDLYVGGLAVGRGYLGRAALTAERFVPDPFGPEPGARLYCTGDRARWLGDGRLIYLGRADGQLKLRGLRIEPGEVEAALRRASGAATAAVVVRQDGGEAQLVAYLAGLAGEPAPRELREQLARSLPAYMIPAAFVRLDELPLTPNGKLDRSALPAPTAHARAAAAYAAPRGALEQELATLWEELLGVSRIGRNDSFFDLGGSSLLVLRLHSRLVAQYGNRVGVADLFTHTTVAAMARLLEQGDDSARWEAAAERGDIRRKRRAAARSHS